MVGKVDIEKDPALAHLGAGDEPELRAAGDTHAPCCHWQHAEGRAGGGKPYGNANPLTEARYRIRP
jgi:hypothetical protein